MNTQYAQSRLAQMTKRADTFGWLCALAAILGLILVIIGFASDPDSYSYDAVAAAATAGFGTLLLSAAGFFLLAWVITKTMSDHAAVGLYSSEAGASLSIVSAAPETTTAASDPDVVAVSVNVAGNYWKCRCGAVNDLDAVVCRNCKSRA